MRRAILVLLLCAAFPAGAAAAPPVEAFAGLPELYDPQLSPDGTRLAAVREADGKPAAIVMSLDPGAQDKRIVIPSDEWIVEDVRWVKDDRAIVIARRSQRFGNTSEVLTWWRGAVVPVDGSPMVMLMRWSSPQINTSALLLDLDPDDPNFIYAPTAYLDGHFRTSYNLMRADLRTGGAKPVLGSASDHTRQWIMDGHGHVVARLDYSIEPYRAHIMVQKDGDWREVWSHDTETAEGTWDVALSEDGSGLILAEDTEGSRLLRYDFQKGGAPESFYESKSKNVHIIRDLHTHRAIGATYFDEALHYDYFSPQMSALQRGLEQIFPGQTVAVVSMDAARDKVIAEVSNPTTPFIYYLVDRTTHQAVKIGAAYPALVGADLGQMRPFPYKARDGLAISANLILPPGNAAKNLPLVVLPHGGPEGRDIPVFNWMAQFLASRGYAVLQANFRGSSGYGRDFLEAGHNQWGLKMQDDLSDGVARLVADGIADPKRVCIVGLTLYGGYAALAGAALTPDLYAYAVSYGGVSDLRKFIIDQRAHGTDQPPSVRYWQDRIGNPFTDSDRLESVSPVLQAAKVKAPMLLMHAEKDTAVLIAQSEAMNDALMKAGKRVRFVRLQGDDQAMEEAETRLRLLQEIEAFLAANIGK